MDRAAFHGLVFSDDFATAVSPDGAQLRFTRKERAVLGRLAGHPRRLLTRDQLHAALGERGSDRNVDFVVNRLRRKLGDVGPERRFITTQYGEGYMWIAPAEAAPSRDAFLLIGPIRASDPAAAQAALGRLQAALQDRFGASERVAMFADPSGGARPSARFSLEVSLHEASGRRHAAFGLREEPGREAVAGFREDVTDGLSAAAADRLASAIAQAVWKRVALGSAGPAAPTDPPLHLRMMVAAILLDPPGALWRSHAEQLARARAEGPADPAIEIMWSMHLLGRLTTNPGPEPLCPRILRPVLDEIEAITLANVEAARGNPLLALAAAKLLLAVHRGHEDLAETLARAAFESSAVFAAALAMLAQITACRGELAEGCRLFDEALRLCEPGSHFEVYLLTLKASTLIAGEDWAAAAAIYSRVFSIYPRAKVDYGLYFIPPTDDGLALTLAPLVDRLSLEAAQRALAYLHYRVATYFRGPGHAANVLVGPLTHLVRRFGPDLLTDEAWSDMPSELAYLRRTPVSRRAEESVRG